MHHPPLGALVTYSRRLYAYREQSEQSDDVICDVICDVISDVICDVISDRTTYYVQTNKLRTSSSVCQRRISSICSTTTKNLSVVSPLLLTSQRLHFGCSFHRNLTST